MIRNYGDRENSRVRDLVDLVILIEQEELETGTLAARAVDVWRERDNSPPPAALPMLPESWPPRYERLAADAGLDSESFAAAAELVNQLWNEMFRSKEI